jgi:hypothetical protein
VSFLFEFDPTRFDRAEMVRLLDIISTEVNKQLTQMRESGQPVTQEERETLLSSLELLLPLVADELQELVDLSAAVAVLRRRR